MGEQPLPREEDREMDVSAVLRLRRGAQDPPSGRIEPAGSPTSLEFRGWLELMAAIERIRDRTDRDAGSADEKDT